MKKTHIQPGSEVYFLTKVKPQLKTAPWLLRVTDLSDKTPPVLVVKEKTAGDSASKKRLIDRASIHGASLARCLPVIKSIISRVWDDNDMPLELHTFFADKRIAFRGNLPLDHEAGYKLALIFKLQEQIKELDRSELIARRVERFTSEEAGYWYSRITAFEPAANRWAITGMRIMLSGYSKDKNIEPMLEKLRSRN